MIVTCTSCQARFRIPDEKIGPKGAKVRCSKCRNVFVAKPAAGAGEAKAPPRDSFAAAPAGAPSDPFAAAGFGGVAAGPGGPPADPFAAPAPPSGSRTAAHHLPVTDLSDLAAAPSGGLTALAPPLPATPAPAAGGPPESAGSVTSADD
ncbi:MAG TPA: zinc-ribbon domain-containing protein, partial [Anaeromyxobacteraceae bacterium]